MKALGWEFTGKFTAQGIVFLVSIVQARLLLPSDFGLIALALVFIGLTQLFSDMGLSSALIQKKDLRQVHYASVFYFNVVAGILLALATFMFADFVAELFASPELSSVVRWLALLFISHALSSVQIAHLKKTLNFRLLARIDISAAIAGGAIGATAALAGAGVWALVLQMLTMGVASTLLLWILGGWKPSLDLSLTALRQLWSFGFRMFLSGVMNAIFARVDYLIIGRVFTPAVLGFFERAKSVNQIVLQYPSNSLMSVLFPILSEIQADLTRLRAVVNTTLRLLCFLVFLLIGALFLSSAEVVHLLFGSNWERTADYFRILVISGFGYPLNALLMNVLAGRGKSKLFLRLEVYKKTLLALNLVALSVWGIPVFLVGLVATSAIGMVLNAVFVRRELSMGALQILGPIATQASIGLMSAALTIIVISLLNPESAVLSLMVKSTLYVVLYCGTCALLKTQSYLAVVSETIPLFQTRRTVEGNNGE